MSLPVYRPRVAQSTIYHPRNGKKPYLRYNHCVDLVRFRGRYLAAWNANTTGGENKPGQYNFISASDDFRRWSAPEPLFAGDRCSPRVTSDNQWQPSFINDQDERLFCAWCDFNARKTYIAVSIDGRQWTNREISPAPPELSGQVVAFPTNHGLRTGAGVLLFPVSYPEITPPGGVGACRYAGFLASHDGGETWRYGGLTQAVAYGAGLPRPEGAAWDRTGIWEPMYFEHHDGRLGLLIRNSGEHDKPLKMAAEDTILTSIGELSDARWPECRSISLESVPTRSFAVRHDDGLLMVMNDWTTASSPGTIPDDRFELALFVAPDADANLLLPGPRIQPGGGRGFYPNGFLAEGKLYCAYTYPNYIQASVVDVLPDFTESFLLPRESRPGLELDEEAGEIRLGMPEGTLGVVPSSSLRREDEICLQFDFTCRVRSEGPFPLLTAGGKNECGLVLLLVFDPETEADRLVLRRPGEPEVDLADPLALYQRTAVALTLGRASFAVEVAGVRREFAGAIHRKIALGGLYWPTAWPRGVEPVRNEIALDLSALTIHGTHDRLR